MGVSTAVGEVGRRIHRVLNVLDVAILGGVADNLAVLVVERYAEQVGLAVNLFTAYIFLFNLACVVGERSCGNFYLTAGKRSSGRAELCGSRSERSLGRHVAYCHIERTSVRVEQGTVEVDSVEAETDNVAGHVA